MPDAGGISTNLRRVVLDDAGYATDGPQTVLLSS